MLSGKWQLREIPGALATSAALLLDLLLDQGVHHLFVLGHIEQQNVQKLTVEAGVRPRFVVDFADFKEQVPLNTTEFCSTLDFIELFVWSGDPHRVNGLFYGFFDVD